MVRPADTPLREHILHFRVGRNILDALALILELGGAGGECWRVSWT